jgi:diaminopimelate decarboxylase
VNERRPTDIDRCMISGAVCVCSCRVEYTKWSGGRHIAVAHVGADLFMRACYLPETWGLRVFVCSSSGDPKEGLNGVDPVQQDIAGPLCFQGDRLAVNK